LARLDDNYTVFGQVFKGMDVVDTIVMVPTDTQDAPLKTIHLNVQVIQLTAEELKRKGYLLKME
jgi:peptidyl-prolyl cis-trans isomerase B (cyclophilin B)